SAHPTRKRPPAGPAGRLRTTADRHPAAPDGTRGMILVDTSVWIDHMRSTEAHLSELLNEGRVCMHPHVLGEIALGSLNHRAVVLEAMQNLPPAIVATDDEVFRFIDDHAL